MNKIFHLQLIKDFPIGMDCICSMAVVAKSEAHARQLAIKQVKKFNGDGDPRAWLDANLSSCQEVDMNISKVIMYSPVL